MGRGAGSGDRGGAGGFFRNVLLLALIGATGYNLYETAQLKSQIAALSRNAAPVRPREDASAASSSFPEGTALMAEARKHADMAEQWLHLKRYENARDEVTAAAQSFKKATADTRTEADKILAQLRSAAKQLSGRSDGAPLSHPAAGDR